MKNYLAIVVLLNILSINHLHSTERKYDCDDNYFFHSELSDGPDEQFAAVVENGDPQKVWFVVAELCILTKNFDIEIKGTAFKDATIRAWDEVFAVTGIEKSLDLHEDQNHWIRKIREADNPMNVSAMFYINSEQLLKLNDSGIVKYIVQSDIYWPPF